MEYSTTSDKFETTYHKPGGTTCGALGQMVHNVVDSVRDDTGCDRWSYLTYAAKEGKKVAIVSAYRVCRQVLGIRPNPNNNLESCMKTKIFGPIYWIHTKQTLIDLQYFVEKLKAKGHKVLILMDANQAKEQTYQPQFHNIKLVTKKGFHVDGTIAGSLQSFMQKCGLINVL
jgi:hypothetical protein